MPREEFYAVIVTQKQMLASDKTVFVHANEKAWVVLIDGWTTSTRFFKEGMVPTEVKRFPTEADAKIFAKDWTGHPWWCQPKSYEIVRVTLVREEHVVPMSAGVCHAG